MSSLEMEKYVEALGQNISKKQHQRILDMLKGSSDTNDKGRGWIEVIKPP